MPDPNSLDNTGLLWRGPNGEIGWDRPTFKGEIPPVDRTPEVEALTAKIGHLKATLDRSAYRIVALLAERDEARQTARRLTVDLDDARRLLADAIALARPAVEVAGG